MEIVIEPKVDIIDPKKCFSCGKTFRTPTTLEAHKNRKTPCLIREVPAGQIANPNRCIFCNKIFVQHQTLTRHLKTCKVKNGGMDILVDKVKYDQEIRILKEQRELDRKNMEDLREEKNQQIQILMEKVQKLEQNVTIQPQTINNVNYNAPVQNINVTINNYTSPDITGLTITAEDLIHVKKLPKFILQKLFFNPDYPQNHCMYLRNKKDKTMIVYDDGNWREVSGANISDVMTQLSNAVYYKGSEIINGIDGPYEASDKHYLELPGGDQHKIMQFNKQVDTLSCDDVYEVFLAGRDVVLDTIKASGCKLV